MSEWIGRNRKARRCYGFDDVALVPGNITINPEEVDCSMKINGKKYPVPIIASAMDGVVDVGFAVQMSKLGGLAVLNLEGVQTRYDNPSKVLARISSASNEKVTRLLQSIGSPYKKISSPSAFVKSKNAVVLHAYPAFLKEPSVSDKSLKTPAAIYLLSNQRSPQPFMFQQNMNL